MEYRYQVSETELSFEQAVEELSKTHHQINFGWVNYRTPEILNEIDRQLKQIPVILKRLTVSKEDYISFFSKAGYPERYPDYYPDNIREKSFEHFICYQLLELKPGDIFIDIASENSPAGEIFSRLSGCTSYSQDIMYDPGIHGNRIGSLASDLPIRDEFFTAAIATCSIEHFENDADIKFMKEMERTLAPGGKIIIAPLYLYNSDATQTDPVYAVTANVPFDTNTTIFCAKNWKNRHQRFYTPKTLMQRLISPNTGIRFCIYQVENISEIDNSIYCCYVLEGTKMEQ